MYHSSRSVVLRYIYSKKQVGCIFLGLLNVSNRINWTSKRCKLFGTIIFQSPIVFHSKYKIMQFINTFWILFFLKFQRRLAMYLRNYSKKYCTETYVSPFLLYFTFCLLLVPLILIFIEKTFVK